MTLFVTRVELKEPATGARSASTPEVEPETPPMLR
jgi:hypothetical protein